MIRRKLSVCLKNTNSLQQGIFLKPELSADTMLAFSRNESPEHSRQRMSVKER
ncbi:hypothetical protein EVA_11901 [gut metagenome]|uniref:Uncharacterized protein n=1 Tax=gut metagenome TaxID=749906 RepID=J9FYB4_9ZZZZ